MSTPKTAVPIQEVWNRYRAKRTNALCNELIVHYAPLARTLARVMYTRLSEQAVIDKDDLYSVGILGLRKAIQAFDQNRGVRFETYASQRIRGAMLDQMRACDWVSVVARRRNTRIETARNTFKMRSGREPDFEELHEELGLPAAAFKALYASGTHQLPLMSHIVCSSEESENQRSSYLTADYREAPPDQRLVLEDSSRHIFSGIDLRSRRVLILRYYEHLKVKETAEMLGISESLVRQIHRSTLQLLRLRPSLKQFLECE